MRYRQINEGFRYGEKQKQEVLSNLDDFGFGIEIEINPQGNDMFDGEIPSGLEADTIMPYLSEIEVTDDNEFEWFAEFISSNAKVENFIGIGLGGSFLYSSTRLKDMLNDLQSSPTEDMFGNEKILVGIQTIFKHIEKIEYIDITQKEIQYEIPNDATKLLKSTNALSIATTIFNATKIDIFEDNNTNQLLKYVKNSVERGISILKTTPASLFDVESIDDIDEETKTDFMEWVNSTDVSEYIESISKIEEMFEEDYDNLFDTVNADIPTQIAERYLGYLYDEGKIQNMEELVDNIEDIVDAEDFIDNWLSHSPYIPQSVLLEIDPSLQLSAMSPSELMDHIDANLQLKTSFEGVSEADGQFEFIIPGKGVSGEDIITAYKESYKIIDYLKDHGFYTGRNSGLHMSISYKKGQMDFDPVMFTVISNTYNAVKGSEDHVRNYVDNMYQELEDNIGELANDIINDFEPNVSIGNVIANHTREYLRDMNWGSGVKFKSVNFQHYYSSDGRVELRFFGGEDYESMMNPEYFDELIRAMYALKMSMVDPSTGKGFAHKEYLHTMYRMTNKIFLERFNISLSDLQSVIIAIRKVEKRTGTDLLNEDYSIVYELVRILPTIVESLDETNPLYKRVATFIDVYSDKSYLRSYSNAKIITSSYATGLLTDVLKAITTAYNIKRK